MVLWQDQLTCFLWYILFMKRLIKLLLILMLLPACKAVQPAAQTPQPSLAVTAILTLTAPPTSTSTSPSATPIPDGKVLPIPEPTHSLTNPGAPDVADYNISVRLDPQTHQITGKETIKYHNTANKPIPDLEFHLYLNAFKDKNTIFMRESGGQLRGDPFTPEHNGWINVTSLQIQGGRALSLDLQQDGTLARAALPQPILPGQAVALDVTFNAQLPQVFARTGWALDDRGDPFFLAGQWFPKLGVWTDAGWKADPFHGNAEFFADFGSYDVALTLPAGYVSGATGLPGDTKKNADGTQTIPYSARGVIDFAWVASPNLKSTTRKVGSTEVVYLYLPEHEWSIERCLGSAVDALQHFSQWYGPYPYTRLTVVDVPEAGPGVGGMEYPTFVTAGASQSDQREPASPWQDTLRITTVHEVAHQWFQSMVATNEGEEPWLDEGFADYSTMRLFIAEYGLTFDDAANNFEPGFLAGRRRRYLRLPSVPMDGKSWDFTLDEYVTAAYAKPDLSLLTLERELGEETMLKIMRTYFERYRFTHPTTADFQKVATEVSGQTLGWFFDGLVYHGQTLNYIAKSIQGETITVDRTGNLVIPVDIQATFADGSTQSVRWDGSGSEKSFTFQKTSPVRSFEIDPDHKLMIELNWSDNQLVK